MNLIIKNIEMLTERYGKEDSNALIAENQRINRKNNDNY